MQSSALKAARDIGEMAGEFLKNVDGSLNKRSQKQCVVLKN